MMVSALQLLTPEQLLFDHFPAALPVGTSECLKMNRGWGREYMPTGVIGTPG